MIKIGLLLSGLYLSVFIFAAVRTRSWPQRAFWWMVLLAPVVVLTWDMPMGYERFKALCVAESGLRIYQANPLPAKVLRMQAEHFNEIDARSLLARYPSLEAIETRDLKFDTVVPAAYARYERDPRSPIPVKGTRDDFKPLVASLDKVNVFSTGEVTFAAGPSQADYILIREHEVRPIRLSITRHWLRKSDGSPIASTTSIAYDWTNAMNMLLGRTAEYCGSSPGRQGHDEQALVDLIAKAASD